MLELAGREPIHGHQLFHGALQFSMLSSTSAPHTEQLLPQHLLHQWLLYMASVQKIMLLK